MIDAIAVFARAPVPGQVKTRLAQAMGDEAAAALAGAMLCDTLALARQAARQQSNCDVVLIYTPVDGFAAGVYSLAPFWAGPRLAQCDGDLGERLLDCVARLHEQGRERVVIIGADSPDLPPHWICHAFSILSRKALVCGPARDGGFYLLGTTGEIPRELFNGVVWSARSTLSQLQANAARLQLSVAAAPQWDDVDTIYDLRRLARRLTHDPRRTLTCAPHTARWLRAYDLAQDI
ncbi:MAG TPA: TIGR04282 family arsenosugar biosynthesis glycosyltransferase [Abditibacteriaceae bacterium]|nr:TIGR04282 family arsenosugar biosynthesis glycosyltransferase [Abditibacteriaceae bacterium]